MKTRDWDLACPEMSKVPQHRVGRVSALGIVVVVLAKTLYTWALGPLGVVACNCSSYEPLPLFW